MNPILFGKPSAMMKRKRSIHQGEFKQDMTENDREEEDYEDDLLANEYNDDSNSSLTSSNSKSSTASSSTTGSLLKAQRIKHGHKIIITEERMNEAMHDLKLEIDNLQESNPQPVCNNDIEFQMSNDDTIIEDDDLHNETEGAILVSEELKAKLRQYKMEDLLLNSHFKHPNQQQHHQDANTMQLVLWTPTLHHFAHSISYDSSASLDSDGDQDSDTSFSSSSSSSGSHNTSTSRCYKIEEPLDIYKKNRLKRKFSQMNKILIEELNNKPNELPKSDQVKRSDQACNFYLVDESETVSTKNTTSEQDQVSSKSGFSIVELPIEDEEKMEI